MSSCTVDETVDKVIIHYLDGRTYAYKGWGVEEICNINWEYNTLNLCRWTPSLVDGIDGALDLLNVYLTEDTMCIESRHSDCVTVWKNPKYKLSVKTDVMTAKQRAKRNQNNGGYYLWESPLVTIDFSELEDWGTELGDRE
jgi:hypothetical protein